MPIETDLSVSPYFDEAAAGLEKNYYKVLFKPSVPVQVRELNELQTILQNQIEEFGDNVLQKGTIVRGCHFAFHEKYPYIKIKDSQPDGAPVNVSALQNCVIATADGHIAKVLNYAEGFESTDPDTKTLYLRYKNSGPNGDKEKFEAGEELYVRDPDLGVTNVVISIAGTGYSNNDTVVFVSAVAVTNVNGTITVGTQMTQPSTGANAVVVSIDSSTYVDKTILTLRPVAGDLTDSTKTYEAWTFDTSVIKSSTNSSVTAVPIETIGTGVSAVVTTDSVGRVYDISMTNYGSGYYVAPYVTVRSTAGGSGVTLTSQNYKARVTVYDGANAVGHGYGFSVSDGVIYQKGYFLNVPKQTIVVSKYDQYPNNVAVGFSTEENIVDAYEDTTLLDNSLGSRNYTAPGADRLQLTPTLYTQASDVARANLEFFAIVEFSEGVPYKQNQRTVYNRVNDEMATRTSDSAGDFVTDRFMVATTSTTNASLIANTFTVVVDPGTAYIDGYRVKTYGNYQFSLNKGIDTAVQNSVNVNLNYGSYVVVDNLAGSFDFSAVGTVELYSTASAYLTSNSSVLGEYSAGTISAPTGQIGTAKVRSIVYADTSSSGYPQGSPQSKYNMYLFDIQMVPGKSFKDVKSIYYDAASGPKGIADVVLENITTAGAGAATTTLGAVLKKTKSSDNKTLNKMIFDSGVDSPLAINTISYQYRTFDDSGTTYTLSTSGEIEITLSGSEYFPYNSELTDSQKQQLVFMPLSHAYANSVAGGTGNSNIGSSCTVVSSTNSSYTSTLRAGDYVKLSGNSTENVIRRVVTAYANGTHLVLDKAPGFTNATGSTTRMFPKYVPLPILTRDGITATASLDARTLTVDLGTQINTGSPIGLAAAFNIKVNNAPVAVKTPNRDLYVKIRPANNDTGFGYANYGSGVDGYFTSGSNTVANSTTSAFTAGQKLKIVNGTSSFLATVGTITNSTFMNLVSAVNFTGNADIYAAVNLDGPWCLGVPDIFRLKAVYMANTSTVNTDSTDVTRDFLIDHNHNTNYADLGYLVKKKDSSLVIGPNDYLLVKFDAFTRVNEDRVVHINSYVDSNKTTRANNDAKPLADLNNSIVNTLEIPEIHAAGGTQFDMINHIDFRPKVANTANLATTVADATINPAYAVSFSASNKKFPVPDSEMTFNTEYFLGRIDTVYITRNGRIATAKGRPANTSILNGPYPDDALTPVKADKSMILNYIKVPAYPSVEEHPDKVINQIIAKRVINDIALNRRVNNKKITRILNEQEIALNQPQRYSMEDIGGLERRIKDLEYYVSLSILELSTKDLNLPSSVSPNINRFKFGFFADSLDDTKYTDVDSPEYKASIEGGRALPPFETISIITEAPPCEYTDFSVISQLKATGNGKDVEPPVCVKENEFLDWDSGTSPGKYDARYITMASDLKGKTGKVTLYAYIYGGSLNRGPVRVYQSKVKGQFPADSAWRSALYTAADSKGLTSSEVSYLRSIPGSTFQHGDSFKKHGTAHGVERGDNGEPKLKRGGKITWNHNPANGNYYKIEIYENGFRARIEYPINVDCDDTGNKPPGGGDKFIGTLKINDITNQYRTVDHDYNNNTNTTWNSSYYRFHLTATGLKPSTKHKIYFNQADLTNLCDTSVRETVVPKPPKFGTTNLTWQSYNAQIPDFFSDAAPGYIMTDASGKIEMYLYVLANESWTAVTQRVEGAPYNQEVRRSTSTYDTVNKPTIEIRNADKSSRCHVVSQQSFTLFSGFAGNKRV